MAGCIPSVFHLPHESIVAHLSLSLDGMQTFSCNIVSRIKRAETVSLLSCCAQNFPEKLFQSKSIVTLSVVNCGEASFPEDAELPSLQELNLSRNQLKQVPSSVMKCSNIRKLNLSCNQITSLPKGINELSVSSLNIMGNPINNLNDATPLLQKVSELKVSATQLSSLPQMPKLEKISVGVSTREDLGCFFSQKKKMLELFPKLKKIEVLKVLCSSSMNSDGSWSGASVEITKKIAVKKPKNFCADTILVDEFAKKLKLT